MNGAARGKALRAAFYRHRLNNHRESPMSSLMLKVVLLRMTENQASDCFISAGAPIYFKTKGHAVPIDDRLMESDAIKEMAYGVLTEQQIKTFETTYELNFALVLPNQGNFRINLFRQRATVAMAVRYIPFDTPSLESLGLPVLLREHIMEKRGLILVVGATGAGKSTTLAAMLNYRISHHDGHVLTLEEPVEYLFRHGKSIVNQRDVGSDAHSYHAALKSALRQSPDCLMIGEIRDHIAMTAAINFALSGHLCVATLHANNSYHALTRIINMYPQDNRQGLLQDLSVSLKSIIAQRLITDDRQDRIPAVEILTNATHIRELIETGDLGHIREAMQKSLRLDMQTFDRALQRLYEAGRITRQTALDNADSPTNLSLMLTTPPLAEKRAPPKSDSTDFGDIQLIYGDDGKA